MTLLICFLLACFIAWLISSYPETSFAAVCLIGLTALLFILAKIGQAAGVF